MFQDSVLGFLHSFTFTILRLSLPAGPTRDGCDDRRGDAGEKIIRMAGCSASLAASPKTSRRKTLPFSGFGGSCGVL
jgi:hypothetical protein